jgi:hypothetical protein
VATSAGAGVGLHTRPKKRHKHSEFETLSSAGEKQVRDILGSLGIAQLENVLVEHCYQVECFCVRKYIESRLK